MMNLQKTRGGRWAGLTAIVLVAGTLTACDGGGGGGGGGAPSGSKSPSQQPAGKTGQLIDSAVAGVDYATATFSGKTDANGEYLFTEGETVVFKIGEIVFPAIAAKGVVTPLDLAGSQNIDDPKVINIARLLQTLDEDQDPSNGIVIPGSAGPAPVDFGLSVADFENQVNSVLGLTLVNRASAMAHLQQALDALDTGTGGIGEPASVPAGFVAVHRFKYEEVTPGAGIPDGHEAEFEVMVGNKLKLPNGTVLENPVHVDGNKVEIIWWDRQGGLAYALSNALTNTLNELNVSNVPHGQPGFQFFGSYTPLGASQEGVPAELLAIGGSYKSQAYYSKVGNKQGWASGDELYLTINSTTGLIDIGGRYSIDPGDDSFSWVDNTATNPRFNPHYAIQYVTKDTNSAIKVLIYKQPGEGVNGWRMTDAPNASDGVNVAAEVIPFAATHQAYFDALKVLLPATLTAVQVDEDKKTTLDEPLCTQYSFEMDLGGVNGKPRLLYSGNEWRRYNSEYSASSSAYRAEGTAKSMNWGSFDLTIEGDVLTATAYQLGVPVGDVLTTDAALIAEKCAP